MRISDWSSDVCSSDLDGAAFAVFDDGIGIDPQDHAKVLRPFEQADNRLSRRYDGVGLGLPLTKAFVEVHGGVLELESAPGQGTRITVRLPAERIADDAGRPPATARGGRSEEGRGGKGGGRTSRSGGAASH